MLLEIVKIPLEVLYLACLVGLFKVKKKQRLVLLICALFMGVLIWI